MLHRFVEEEEEKKTTETKGGKSTDLIIYLFYALLQFISSFLCRCHFINKMQFVVYFQFCLLEYLNIFVQPFFFSKIALESDLIFEV